MAVAKIEWKGAPAREETGTGVVLSIDHKEGQLNARVEFRATHSAKIVEPISAWVATNEPAYDRCRIALREGIEVWYRIVVHRRKGIDPAIPLDEVGKREKVRDLVEVRRAVDDPLGQRGAHQVGPATGSGAPALAAAAERAVAAPAAVPAAPLSDPRVIEGTVVERPAPVAGGLPPAGTFEGPPPAGAAEPLRPDIHTEANVLAMRALRRALADGDAEAAALHEGVLLDAGVPIDEIARATGRRLESVVTGPGTATREGPRSVAAEALARASDPQRLRGEAPPVPDLDPETLVAPPAVAPPVSAVSGLSRRSGAQPVASDSKPWEYFNSDGLPNLSSYAAGATMEFVNLAGRLIVTHLRQRAAEDPAYVIQAPSADAVRSLADLLLNIADLAQASLHDGARRDRMASSHRLARQSVREAIDLYPVPWGRPPEERAAWKLAVVQHASTLVGVAYQLLTP